MEEETKQISTVTIACTIIIVVAIMSIRSCVVERARLNTELQAKCIAADGFWEDSRERCITGRKAGA